MDAACYTYQIAIKMDQFWTRDYVCASDRKQAVLRWLEDHPMYSLGWLVDECEQIEVERCA